MNADDYGHGYDIGFDNGFKKGLTQGYNEGWAAAEAEVEAEMRQKLDRILDLLDAQRPKHIDLRQPTPLKVGDEVRVTQTTMGYYEEGVVFTVGRVERVTSTPHQEQWYYVVGPEEGGWLHGIWPKFLERTNGHPISYEYQQED